MALKILGPLAQLDRALVFETRCQRFNPLGTAKFESYEMKQLPLPDINHSLLEMVGNTILLEIKNIDVGLCRLFVKWNLKIQVDLLKIVLQCQ